MKITRILILVVTVVFVTVLSGCTTPAGNAALLRTPNGTEVGSIEWGNAGLTITSAQHRELLAMMREYNVQQHQVTVIKKENQLHAHLANKKTKIILKNKYQSSADAIAVMGATYGARSVSATKEY